MYLLWSESREELEGTKQMRGQNPVNSVLIGLEIAQGSSSVLECVRNRHLSPQKEVLFS